MNNSNMELANYLGACAAVLEECKILSAEVDLVVDEALRTLRVGNALLWAGNGGSAAEAQHLSAELVGRFVEESSPYKSISLTTDTSALTAIGNDYGFEHVFSRQLEAIGQRDDMVVAFSTSGKSLNILKLLECARSKGIKSVLFTGNSDERIAGSADIEICIPSSKTWHIQEAHAVLGHFVCARIEQELGFYD